MSLELQLLVVGIVFVHNGDDDNNNDDDNDDEYCEMKLVVIPMRMILNRTISRVFRTYL